MLNRRLFLNPALFDAAIDRIPTRNGYGDGLVEVGALDPRVIKLTGDLESTRAHLFQKIP